MNYLLKKIVAEKKENENHNFYLDKKKIRIKTLRLYVFNFETCYLK